MIICLFNQTTNRTLIAYGFKQKIMKTVFINQHGYICDESISKYKVVLNGSYSYCNLLRMYKYETYSIEPKLGLKYILSHKIL